MIIRDLFEKDIKRQINGVIKVNQSDETAVKQEVEEYVITNELRKHFASFFNFYSDAFDQPTDNIGVWISGFFGSGKSHFLKMLSYILENKKIGGTSTVEYFREKFSDDPGTFMQVDKATRHETETILFNIDIEGPIDKDATAVLRVFAKMFYNHLGFYGEDLKLAKLEQYIDQKGKTEEFRRVFAEIDGTEWLKTRDSYAFKQDSIVETLKQVLKMSDNAANTWFDGSETIQTSIAQLVSEIKSYVASKPDGFRLLFMVDEVGQYAGSDVNLLLNLQSLIEEIGTKCGEKVWVICTGQEAIDEIIKVRLNEFSRIQARFKTRLSLSSSSVDEVIQKRILKKKSSVQPALEQLYNENISVLKNLFSFAEASALLDIKGFTGPQNFVDNYPFIPYQFILMQKAFAEIRKHGNAGIHLSGGERSMLSGFQEAVQKIQDKDEYALVPFWRFYDTVNTFLDGAVRRVIDRCAKAAMNGDGIEPQDVNVLKLLFLIRHVSEDLKANIDNIVILMADDLRVDKLALKDEIRASLERLQKQNYVGKSGELYNFLSDEEQNVQRGIRETDVGGTAPIIERIGTIVFGDIYQSKKFHYGKYDFAYEQMVDCTIISSQPHGMKLRLMTLASDANEKNELNLVVRSKGEAIVLLAENSYYDLLEKAMKIRKYVKQHNVRQLPKSVQDIICTQQEEAARYETAATEELKRAIEEGQFYVDGEHITVQSGDAKNKIEQALKYLVVHVYSDLNLIEHNVESDAEIATILKKNTPLLGEAPNTKAAAKIEDYLEMQYLKHLNTSMADIQSRYQAIPYGWREIDIASVVAQLICEQRVTVKYAGETIQPTNPRLPDMLRKKSEVGKTIISKRQSVSAGNMKKARLFLREYFGTMDVPEDEDGLIQFIVYRFHEQQDSYVALNRRYEQGNYPEHKKLETALRLCNEVLLQQKDNTALIDMLLKRQGDLEDSREDMQAIDGFFKNQVVMFDSALKLVRDVENDLDYIEKVPEAKSAYDEIKSIIDVNVPRYNYKNIPKLGPLTTAVHTGMEQLLNEKRTELTAIAEQCREAVKTAASECPNADAVLAEANSSLDKKLAKIAGIQSLALLNAQEKLLIALKDEACSQIETLKHPAPKTPNPEKKPKQLSRQIVFPRSRLEKPEDVDAYVQKIREQLLKELDGQNPIELV